MYTATESDPSVLIREFLVGSSVSGVRFGAPQLLFSPASGSDEVFINLLSVFQVFAVRPMMFPANEADVPEQTQEEEILALFDLRGVEVADAEIVRPAGHLAVTFVNGAVLYVNGSNSGPEPWHVGLNANDRSETTWIIALTGDEPLVFRPFSSER